MTRNQAAVAMDDMRDFSGMYKVIKKANYNSIDNNDNDWYVDYVPYTSMSGSMEMPTYTIEKDCRASAIREDYDSIPLHIWLKAGTPPNGRSKKQHIAIQNLNKRKKR